MEKAVKICLVILFAGYLLSSFLFKIPEKINNVIYGIMALFSLFFILTNKNELGINDIFKKKDSK